MQRSLLAGHRPKLSEPSHFVDGAAARQLASQRQPLLTPAEYRKYYATLATRLQDQLKNMLSNLSICFLGFIIIYSGPDELFSRF